MAWSFREKPRSGTETALDACDYFVDEVLDTLKLLDTKEEMCLLKHKELRQAVMSGDKRTVSVLLEALGDEKETVVNMSPGGANTLLFLACQAGYEELSNFLILAGADGRLHPVTKYSPLYAAVHHGHFNITKSLLDKFPELVQQTTVERWLPLHAACINGHTDIVELLINYKYPEELYKVYRDEKNEWEWKLPFDPNQQDVTGQTSLYIASILGNKCLVNLLLSWKVKCYKISEKASNKNKTPVKTTPKRVSFGIENILSKLNLTADRNNVDDDNTCEKCPIVLNLLCGAARETALLAAVRGGFTDVVLLLLQQGADPNIMARPVEDQNDPKCSEEIYGLSRVPLSEACNQKSSKMVEVLLKYGARDEQSSALAIAVTNDDEPIITQLLSKRVYPDSDYKINKKGLPTPVETKMFLPSPTNVTYSSYFPNVATIINWHNSNNVHLPYIKMSWMVDAVLQLNPKLQKHPKVNEITLTAITRIDLSNNNLVNLPAEIFHLISLRYLNVAQNKLEKLHFKNVNSPTRSSNTSNLHSCAVLEELYLQDNRLITVPPEIFQFQSLIILDLSNNKLQEIPFGMWKSPKLRELNLAFNFLKDLPIPSVQINSSTQSHEKANFQAYLAGEKLESKRSQINPGFCAHPLIHRNIWSSSIEITDNDIRCSDTKQENGISQLNHLNIANNMFTSIPIALPCLAVNLTRLNMSYNNLRSMGHVTSYPASLKQLDLSHNEITCWPSLPGVTGSDPSLRCYSDQISCDDDGIDGNVQHSIKTSTKHAKSSTLRSSILKAVCRHRKHLRLESLRTLILADNSLTRIQLSTDDASSFNESDDSDWRVVGITKSKLIFPNLSMLDISNNCLREIPASLHELSSLSVLNISGNVDVTCLPPQLGHLSRLWNLNTRGCLLQEPLHSMIESKKYKTMDIIGYLKSIYEDAQPYTRMKLMVVGVQGIGKTTLLELLRYEGGQKSRAGMDHWTKRMGHKNINKKSQKYANISTVGVDIGTWVCDRRKKDNFYYGPVIFRTWDFGGQKEYYATHQYFLSKRSLYLVLWRITDGHKGLVEVLQWLGNIQARAPNSPVIIVGTHYDAIGETFSAQTAAELQRIIREKFIAIPDAEKVGLPRVMDSVEVSCRTFHNIQLLSNIIYDTAFTLKSPGSKEPLLLQKVPASYIALEDIVNSLSNTLKLRHQDPVLDTETYKKLVTEEMRLNHHKNFRDWAELSQATMFLHDNGIMLHYDDATLRDFYFLDPQWLCDMLAHVVTVREINPFARNGIMKLEDLQLLFRYNNSDNNRSYIVHLLNKFEVALTWDSRTLLIPSLLPLYDDDKDSSYIKIAQRMKTRSISISTPTADSENLNLLYSDLQYDPFGESDSIKRIVLMTYFPSGFWSRLITRILADDQIIEGINSMYMLKNETNQIIDLQIILRQNMQWKLWQTGISLCFGDIVVMKIWEVPFNTRSTGAVSSISILRNNLVKFKLKLDGIWNDINVATSSILEINLPLTNIAVTKSLSLSRNQNGETEDKREIIASLEPNFRVFAKFLALIVDHIDLLLEDWYPSLGTRFVHTSEGRFLVTRLVLCPECLRKIATNISTGGSGGNGSILQSPKNFLKPSSLISQRRSTSIEDGAVGCSSSNGLHSNNFNLLPLHSEIRIERNSQDSLNLSDADSGVGPDSMNSSRNPSVDGNPQLNHSEVWNTCYMWMVESCILSVYNQNRVICPLHFEVDIHKIAPDVVFSDIPEKFMINPESIVRGSLLGRGAFGFVFRAKCKMKNSKYFNSVAMKMLQPIPPGPKAKESAIMAYKIALGKWDRDPLQYSCKAYCTARQELAVLLTLKHPNIVEFVGLCIKPLALILELAPMGGLDSILRQYRRSGAHIGHHAFQAMSLQVARALEYLHRKRIIYRDLKSENILAWEFPPINSDDTPKCRVYVKIADYGISRITAPSGSKGFGGTEGFMAPEIIKYNGEEEYTEKVDCFSFGMFLYEIISLRQPFEGQESIKECILEGIRPALTPKEACFPSYGLDLMTLCWNEDPKKRPSASQIVSILSAPEVIHLLDVIVLSNSKEIDCGIFRLQQNNEDEATNFELWLPCYNSKIDILEISSLAGFIDHHSLNCDFQPMIEKSLATTSSSSSAALGAGSNKENLQKHKIRLLCCCLVEDYVWTGDSEGNLHVFNSINYSKVFSYMFEPVMKEPIVSLIYLKEINRVSVGLFNGRLFLVDPINIPSNYVCAEGSFVLTELFSGEVLNTACAIWKNDQYELWCGGDSGLINIYPIKDSGVSGHASICHWEEKTVRQKAKVYKMYSSFNYVFTCLLPGFTVYQWKLDSKKIQNKLDCSKLFPCSESISIEEQFSFTKCQVSAIAIQADEIYIGTTWGCVIVADIVHLRPITIFRPYEEEIKAIIPVPYEKVPLIATIGRKYRSLLSQYIKDNHNKTLVTPTTETNLQKNISFEDKVHCILWRAENWV